MSEFSKFLTLRVRQFRTFLNAPIAQLDRASVYGTEGYLFESDWVYFFMSRYPRDLKTFLTLLVLARLLEK